jgi:YD repeat-containing protein
VDIETATADQLYRLLLDVQDRLGELVAAGRLTLARDAEQAHGTARNAVGQVVHHLDAARQVLAVLETRE